MTKQTAQPESGREAPSVLRVRTLLSAMHPGLEDAREAGQSGRREGGTTHAYSAPGLAASFESWAQVRACALGGGARVGRCLGWASAGNGVVGAAAHRAVRAGRPRALFPHRRDRKALLHRGNPRRDHGYRSGGARVDRALRVLPTRSSSPLLAAPCGRWTVAGGAVPPARRPGNRGAPRSVGARRTR